jgi:hypothetical protein
LLRFGRRNLLEKMLIKTETIEKKLNKAMLAGIRLVFAVEIAKEEKSITTHK